LTRRSRGTALVEFALCWPLAVLLVMLGVQLGVWGAESAAAHAAASAGARAATVSGANVERGGLVALRSLAPALAGTRAGAWCPGQAPVAPQVWVCARDVRNGVEVSIGGTVPALIPVLGANGLPVHADVTVQKETFMP